MKPIDVIASCGVEACLLEAGAKKPGNVYPGRGFAGTSYRDFIRGSKAFGPMLREAARRGFEAGDGSLAVRDIGIGRLVLRAVRAVKKSHSGGNTHLGIALLFVPLSAAAGFCVSTGGMPAGLRACFRRFMKGTTVDDAIGVFNAILTANPGGLGRSRLDVRDKASKARLQDKGFSLLRLMGYSSRRDRIAGELSAGMPAVFGFVLPNLDRNLLKTGHSNAIVQTYLQTLAKYPDTLIARKAGRETARDVSNKAKFVLQAGGIFTPNGRQAIRKLDSCLRSDGNKLNPGTTADLIAAGLYVHLLKERINTKQAKRIIL
ncbi:MAG: triphosphoribosyl-dephospho-CoA synthase [Candidatus Altiarchaeota archaeon]|nr:triphosphoribosyl-dephospho-CoA synthase [Candidatus Altiarchaeota archaeon]